MLGMLIGTVCLIGLIKTLRWGRRGGGWGHRGHRGHGGCGGGGYGRRGWGGGGPWDGDDERGGGWGPGAFMRGMFRRLDTTPGQEKVIVQAIDEMRAAAREARGEARTSRTDVAKALRSESFDAVLFGEMFARHDTTLEGVRKAAVGAFAKIHDALDEKQRARLAEMLESGPGFFRGGGWAAQASL
jgi:Spy/CpxP family protein refolding chaperone